MQMLKIGFMCETFTIKLINKRSTVYLNRRTQLDRLYKNSNEHIHQKHLPTTPYRYKHKI